MGKKKDAANAEAVVFKRLYGVNPDTLPGALL
jgi:hypothetical protein